METRSPQVEREDAAVGDLLRSARAEVPSEMALRRVRHQIENSLARAKFSPHWRLAAVVVAVLLVATAGWKLRTHREAPPAIAHAPIAPSAAPTLEPAAHLLQTGAAPQEVRFGGVRIQTAAHSRVAILNVPPLVVAVYEGRTTLFVGGGEQVVMAGEIADQNGVRQLLQADCDRLQQALGSQALDCEPHRPLRPFDTLRTQGERMSDSPVHDDPSLLRQAQGERKSDPAIPPPGPADPSTSSGQSGRSTQDIDDPALVPTPTETKEVAPEPAIATEARLLDEANQLLRKQHRPKAALERLADLKSRVPEGELQPERQLCELDALMALEKREHALTLLDSMSLAPRSTARSLELLVLRGELRANVHRYSDAVADFSAALAEATGSLLERALYGRGICLKRAGRVDEAKRDFGAYLTKFADRPRAAAVKNEVGTIENEKNP